MTHRALRPAAAGLGLVLIAGCMGRYEPGPTTTTTTVVRDSNGVPIASGTTTRDSFGNTVTTTPSGTYQAGPSYPAAQPQTYRTY